MTKPFRCHDAEACALGQKSCPTPWACGCEEITMTEYINECNARDLPFIKLISECIKTLSSKTCCEVHNVANCNQGRACPVRNGTHKPADALHNIEEPNGKAD